MSDYTVSLSEYDRDLLKFILAAIEELYVDPNVGLTDALRAISFMAPDVVSEAVRHNPNLQLAVKMGDLARAALDALDGQAAAHSKEP